MATCKTPDCTAPALNRLLLLKSGGTAKCNYCAKHADQRGFKVPPASSSPAQPAPVAPAAAPAVVAVPVVTAPVVTTPVVAAPAVNAPTAAPAAPAPTLPRTNAQPVPPPRANPDIKLPS